MENIQKDNSSTISKYHNDHILFIFIFQYYIQKMSEIEEIVQDRIVIELESLKKELKEEIKRLESESNFTDDTSYSIFLENQVEGIELAIDIIDKRIQNMS